MKTGRGLTGWRVEESDLPWRPNWADVVRLLVGYAVRAPSSHNTEPWRFRGKGERIEVWADAGRWLRVADRDRRELYLSVGCALENLLIAAGHLGYGAEVEYFPDASRPDCVAVVKLKEGGVEASFRREEWFDVIPERCTNHQTFLREPVRLEALERIARCVVEPELRLHVIDDVGLRRWVAELLGRAEEREFRDPAFRAELAQWLGGGAPGVRRPWARIAGLAVRRIDVGSRVARREMAAVESAPVVCVLTSERNDRLTHVRAGMAVERMWLEATSQGLSVQPLSALMQVADVRRELAGLLGTPERHPLHAFRLGFAEPESRLRPRRPLGQVLELEPA